MVSDGARQLLEAWGIYMRGNPIKELSYPSMSPEQKMVSKTGGSSIMYWVTEDDIDEAEKAMRKVKGQDKDLYYYLCLKWIYNCTYRKMGRLQGVHHDTAQRRCNQAESLFETFLDMVGQNNKKR